MKEIMEIRCPEGAENLSDMAKAMEHGAVVHSIDLQIDYDRVLGKFGCLWMLVRYQVRMTRFPVAAMRVETFLRKPSAVFSLRDFTFFDEQGECGTAVQTWVLADEKERKVRPISSVPPLLDCPVKQPERGVRPRRFKLPADMTELARWAVLPEEIDKNGHLNNVAYVRHAEALAPQGCSGIDVCFERECFLGETLILKGASNGDEYFIGIYKESGELSFSACFISARS